MSDHVFKTVEITGSSPDGREAMDRAIAKAAETVRGLDWFELTSVRGRIDDVTRASRRSRAGRLMRS